MVRFDRFGRLVLPAVLLAASAAAAVGQQLSSNWNPGACDFTDVAALAFPRPTHLERVEIWYHWQPQETSVPYTVAHEGRAIGGGTLVRGECDPYQVAWCVARDVPNADLAPGAYTFRTERARICQNQGSYGHGFVRAFGWSQ